MIVAAILFVLSMSIMLLSIVSSNHFKDDTIVKFVFSGASKHNSTTYNNTKAELEQFTSQGYQILKTCNMNQRYFTQGLEVLEDQ